MGCGLATRFGVGPSITTSGNFGVEARISFGFGPGSQQTGILLDAEIGGGAVDNAGPLLSGGVGVTGILVADKGPSGRLGLSFVGRRHFADGTSRGSQGIGLAVALLHALSGTNAKASWDMAPGIAVPTGRRSGHFLLGGGASLDWVWGKAGSFGTLWVPAVIEYWRFAHR